MDQPLGIDEVAYKKWSRDTHRLITVKRRGSLFSLAGSTLALFPVSVLAEAIDRTPKSIMRWEQQGLFPKSQWKVPNRETHRMYSSAQIRFIHELHMELSRQGDHGFIHSIYFPLRDFLERVREGFYKVDAAIVQKGRKTA